MSSVEICRLLCTGLISLLAEVGNSIERDRAGVTRTVSGWPRAWSGTLGDVRLR
jgi:hypothetical protein